MKLNSYKCKNMVLNCLQSDVFLQPWFIIFRRCSLTVLMLTGPSVSWWLTAKTSEGQLEDNI